MMKRIVGALALASMAASTSAQTGAGEGYHLGANDQIEVTIYGQPETIVRTRIKSNGTIALPLVGNVTASGETVESLADEIEHKLKSSGLLNNPIVNVEISAYASRTVTLLGEIGTPGIQPLDHSIMLSEMVARAGGLKAGASDFVSLRHAGSEQTENYSLSAIARGAQRDVALRPGDVIFVAPAEHYFVYGQVGSAGVYPILPNMTVRQALARAGGPTQAGSENKLTLYRANKPVDVDLDTLVRPDDVLFVKERVF